MKELFIKSKTESKYTLVLLHGTGGRETDLLSVAATVDQSANVLAFRGDVNEAGQTRFFKRLALKKYDEESLQKEGEKLYYNIIQASKTYDFDLEKTFIIGYSNGANIATHLLLNYEMPILGALLMHPGYFSEQVKDLELSHLNILITAGAKDMMTTAGDAFKVKQLFETRGAASEVKLTDGGHEIDSQELMEGHVYLLQIKSKQK